MTIAKRLTHSPWVSTTSGGWTESRESSRADRRPFSQKWLVHAGVIGSLCPAPRASHNRAPACISRTAADFRRSVSKASNRLPPTARPRSATAQKAVAPRVGRLSELGPREQIGLPDPARSMFYFADRWVRYRVEPQRELLWGPEANAGANFAALWLTGSARGTTRGLATS